MSTPQHIRSRKNFIAILIACFVCLLAFTVRAFFQRSVFDNAALMKDVWFQVTLLDAYLGFLLFYVWVAWKEESLLSRLFWFILIITFGNMATTLYVIVQIVRHPKHSPVSEILLRQRPASECAVGQ